MRAVGQDLSSGGFQAARDTPFLRILLLACLCSALACAQTNLNFGEGSPGAAPPGWLVLDMARDAGFTASWQSEGCRAALPCAVIAAPANPPAGAFGGLMQSFPAQPYRGKSVRLRAWVRLEPKAAADRAQMLLHVERPNLQPGFVDNMADRPITAGDWRQYEIRGEVAPDAVTISIGLTLYGTGRAWIGEVEFAPVVEETAGPALDAARDAIAGQYARLDAAFARGDTAAIAAILMPGAQMRVGTIREPLLPAIQSEIAKGSQLLTRTVVTAVRLAGDEAAAMVRRDARYPAGEPQASVVTTHRDTWARTPDGWRLQESIEVSYHFVLPTPSAEEIRPVVAELKQRAAPLGAPEDLAAFGSAVGDARIVALGEAAHGTREFAQWKERLAGYLAAQKGFTILMASGDPEMRALADRLHLTLAVFEGSGAEAQAAAIVRLATVTYPQAKIVLCTDNAHARQPLLRQKFGRKLYSVAFAFQRGEFRAVGVENGESRGLGVYTAGPSPEGSGDAVLSAAGMPQFFLNLARLPYGGALERWLSGPHLYHDLGAYWVLDDPDASLQPEELVKDYDGLVFIAQLHAA